MNWFDILKKLTGKAKGKGSTLDTDRIKINIQDDNCNKKLQEAQVFCAAYAKKIEPVLKKTIKEINENNPPTNKESHTDGRKGTAPFYEVHKEVEDGMTTYEMPTVINRGSLSVSVYHKYEPINEEAACKLIEMFNSEEAKENNIYEYDIEPRLDAANKKGHHSLGYNYPFNYLAAGGYPKKVNIGIAMSRGFFRGYDNQDEHVKQIWDAIRFSDAQQKLNSILK